MKKKRASLPPHWYKIYIGECPVCGRDQSYRERRLTPKPLNPEDRYEEMSDFETYDGCMD